MYLAISCGCGHVQLANTVTLELNITILATHVLDGRVCRCCSINYQSLY